MLDETPLLPLDVPPEVERLLRAAGAAWHDEARAERLVLDALALAPGALQPRISAYKFYFYRHRLSEALPQALACVDFAATALGLDRDWRRVSPGDAPFAALSPLPKLWLQALMAFGYVSARLGRDEDAREALGQVSLCDPKGILGAGRLLDVIARGGADEDEQSRDLLAETF